MQARIALVTSGARGLGHAVVRSMLESGWDVFFTYGHSLEEAKTLEREAASLGRRAVAVQADLLDRQSVGRTVDTCLELFGKVDALIHNFGPFVFERVPLSDYTPEMWTRMIDGNLTNFVWLYQAVVPGMRQRGFGRICTIGCDGAAEAAGWRFRSAYAAAKAGLASLTRTIAREERQNGITANMICPGDIRGEHKMRMIREVRRESDPLGRPPVGEDVARVVVFLCREDSQQVNGTVVEVTGGYDILAYDDGKQVVTEEPLYREGDPVWVHPWQRRGIVTEVRHAPNRNVVYEVRAGDESGSFTRYQLSVWEEEE